MAQRAAANIVMGGVDELFGITADTPAEPAMPPGAEMVVNLPLADLYMFKDHPFSVVDDKEMFDLSDTIKANGVLMPAIVRPHPTNEGGYEIVAGHRRKRGSELAGLDAMPCIIREMDDDTATIYMVDSNNQRENVKPSEKAKALKMKMDAMKRKAGRPSKENGVQVEPHLIGKKTKEIVAEQAGESVAQVQRLMRLNELEPELLSKVDTDELKLTPAVELSFLAPAEQKHVAEMMDVEGRTPSLSQAQQLKKLSQENRLDKDTIEAVFVQPRPQEQRRVVLQGERLDKYFPPSMTPVQIEEKIYKALEEQKKRETKEKNRAER